VTEAPPRAEVGVDEHETVRLPPALSVVGLSKRYGGIDAARDVTFTLAQGEVLALAGANGAGKSTVIGMLGGVRRPDAGRIEVDGTERTFASSADAHRAGIGVVFQEPMLVPQLSVIANVFLSIEKTRRGTVIDRPALRKRYRELVDTTGIDLDPNCLVHDLSVAQRQLTQVLRVTALGARVIILDEPTAALSPPDRTRLFALINDLRSRTEPASFIIVSHFLEELERHCDRAVVLKNGAVVGELAPGSVKVAPLARLMRGGDGPEAPSPFRQVAKRHANDVDPVMSVRGLRIGDGEPIDFDLRPGEILGLAGLVGSGRTSILRAIGLGRGRREGVVSVGGRPVKNAVEATRAGLLLLPEDRAAGLISFWPLWMNVTLPSLQATSVRGVTRPDRERARTEALFRRLSVVAESPSAPLSSLSGGNQQKVAIAKLLAADFRVALLDEPTHGIDVHAKREIEQIISELAAEGKSFILVSAEFDELLRVATSVAVVFRGRVGERQPVGPDLTAETLLVEAATGQSPAEHEQRVS
jgi:ribose transport system ATP-binding protein